MRKVLAGYESTTLPIMPATAAALRRQLGGRSTDNHHLEQTLLLDPAATIALYRLVGRRFPNAADNIAGPAHAISMIGHEAFTKLVNDLPLVADKKVARILSPAFAYCQAAHAGWYAKCLSAEIQLGKPDAVQVAALLQNPAILGLWQRDFEAAARASNAMRDGVPQDVAFTAELGEPLHQANQRLAEAWHFPQLTIECMGDWDPFNRQPQTVMLADMLAQTSSGGWRTEEVTLQSEILEDFLNRQADDATSWWHQAAAESARAMQGLGYPLPAAELVQIPGEEEIEVPDFSSRRRHKEAAPSSPTLNELVAHQMKRIRNEAGVQRVVFAMLNKDRSLLQARMALGGNKDAAIRQFKLGMNKKHLFSLMLNKSQSLWLRADNKKKYQPYLSAIPLDDIATAGFFAISLFIRGKPLGLLYADGGSLDETAYRRFRKLSQEISQTLEGRPRAA